MIKVTIEADGEEKKILTGEMLNMAVLGEDGCKIAMVSQPTKRGISSNNFIQSLQKLVQCSIKSFAQGDKTMESILKVCFAEAMIERPDGMRQSVEDEIKANANTEDFEEVVPKQEEDTAVTETIEEEVPDFMKG